MPVINSLTDGNLNIPGAYSIDLAASGMTLTDKYSIDTNTTPVLFPGLFAGRVSTSANFTQITSLDQITSPTVADIVGVVPWQIYGANTVDDLSYLNMVPLPAGQQIQLMQDAPGWINVFAGSAIDGTVQIAVATTTTGSGPTTVYAGSLVTTAFAGPHLSLAGLATLNPLFNNVTYAAGDLVPVSLQIINR